MSFKVPIDVIESDENGIILDTSVMIPNSEWTSSISNDAMQFSRNTVNEKLLSHYKSIDISQIDVKLNMKIMDTYLESIFLLPFTRSQISEEPSIRKAYRAMLLAKRENSPHLSALKDDMLRNARLLSSCTILADVSILCLEKFQVKNKTTGELIQGQDAEETRIVYHLVRFEKDSVEDAWKIVDYDDTLEGNVWY
jgi:hypothetical protein